MLLHGPVHVAVLRYNLRCGLDIPIHKPVPLGTETTFDSQIIQVVIYGFTVGIHAQLHVDLFNSLIGVLKVILRQSVKYCITGIKRRITVLIIQQLRCYEYTFPSKVELICVRIIGQVNLSQGVNRIGKQCNPHWITVILVSIVGDIQPVNDKLRLSRTGLYPFSEAGKHREL